MQHPSPSSILLNMQMRLNPSQSKQAIAQVVDMLEVWYSMMSDLFRSGKLKPEVCEVTLIIAQLMRICFQVAYMQIGLGTDVGGGYSPSMLSAVRNAVIASKALRMQSISKGLSPEEADKDLLNWKEAMFLATQGGAQALGIQVSIARPSGLELSSLSNSHSPIWTASQCMPCLSLVLQDG